MTTKSSDPMREQLRVVGFALGSIASALAVYFLFFAPRVQYALHEIGLVLFVVAVSFGALFWMYSLSEQHDREWRATYEEVAGRIDPWAMQRKLMEASGQRIPDKPTLHNGVLLYAALQMEELGEEVTALSHALLAIVPTVPTTEEGHRLSAILDALYRMGAGLDEASKLIRTNLETVHVELPLDFAHAVELFDGTTDLAVVNSGFAVSCGFDGGAGYAEVGLSNLSKANPATGLIDKDAGGKWIKGAGYFPPNLARVLARPIPGSRWRGPLTTPAWPSNLVWCEGCGTGDCRGLGPGVLCRAAART